MEVEADLRQMDPKAWSYFKAKNAHLLTITDKWDWNTQLFDRLDEAKGYCFLKEQGYTDIQFNPERQDLRTPDLSAIRQDERVMLEVKTIHESDDENDYMMRRGEWQNRDKMRARNVDHYLSDAMKRKLQKTICGAAEQLDCPGQDIQRRILLLFVRLDLKCATKDTFDALDRLLKGIHLKNVEIHHMVKNEIIL